MATASTMKQQPQPTQAVESADELEARLLAGASARIRADVEEAQRRAIIDAQGNLLSDELPPDMRPGAQRDFGG